jgi:hypothetical protein
MRSGGGGGRGVCWRAVLEHAHNCQHQLRRHAQRCQDDISVDQLQRPVVAGHDGVQGVKGEGDSGLAWHGSLHGMAWAHLSVIASRAIRASTAATMDAPSIAQSSRGVLLPSCRSLESS